MLIKTDVQSVCEVFYLDKMTDVANALPLFNGIKIAIFASSSIGESVIFELAQSLKKRGAEVFINTIKDGELCKTIENATALALFLEENGFTRKDAVLNVGGGTVCDSGGFTASIYKRGIRFYNFPTTVLCAVDACIGGKTAVDCGGVKNLLGTFCQPNGAFIVKELLPCDNLELIEAGKSEIVKYAVLDREFLRYLQALPDGNVGDFLFEIIEKCLDIKKRYVQADLRDEGVRHALNLGHTAAHAAESKYKYAVSHAEAVKLGLLAETALSYKIGAIGEERYAELCALYLKFFNRSSYELEDLLELIPFALHDKKNEGGKIAFVLPSDDGCEKREFTVEELIKTIKNAD